MSGSRRLTVENLTPQMWGSLLGCGPAFQRVQPAESRLRAGLPAPHCGKLQTASKKRRPGRPPQAGGLPHNSQGKRGA
jgi:hypothetical protein